MIDLRRFAAASAPLTLARCASGFLPWLMADAARVAKTRAVFIAADDASARSLADAASFFAPEIDVISLPAWDCLPYDRASPGLRLAAERLAALAALAEAPTRAQLIVTTVNAVTQRTLPPDRIKALTAIIKPAPASTAMHWPPSSPRTAMSAPIRWWRPANMRCAARCST